jgi:nicotinate phosphoribosyltransferase
MVAAGAPIDAYGIGTQLATSFDAPALSAVYKMVELRRRGEVHYTAKFSDEKKTLPGAKQIYRFADHDVVTLASECNSDYAGAEPLLRPVINDGDLLETLPGAAGARIRALRSIDALPAELRSLDTVPPYRIEMSPKLLSLAVSVRAELQAVRA